MMQSKCIIFFLWEYLMYNKYCFVFYMWPIFSALLERLQMKAATKKILMNNFKMFCIFHLSVFLPLMQTAAG